MLPATTTAITHQRWPFKPDEEDIAMSINNTIVNPFLESLFAQSGGGSSGTVTINAGVAGQQVALTPQQIAGVVPGDIITSELMNQILARLTLLEASRITGILLGPLSENTHTIVALGTGFESGGGIFLDGVSLLAGPVQRGINLVILDPNLTVKFRSAYDTLGSINESDRLVTDLQNQAVARDLVVVATHDAFLGISNAAKFALGSVGGEALGRVLRLRDNGAFIGVVPNNRSNISFNYLASLVPADSEGSSTALLSALPFVWGIYSIPLKRFLVGGGSNTSFISTFEKNKETKESEKSSDKAVKDTDKTFDKIVKDTDKGADKAVKETEKPAKETDKIVKETDKALKDTDVAPVGKPIESGARALGSAEDAPVEEDDASVSQANGRAFIRSEERPDVEQKAVGKEDRPKEDKADQPEEPKQPAKSKPRRKPTDARRRRKSS